MDDITQWDIIEKAMLILDMQLDSDNDSLFEYYFQNAIDYISDYCNVSEITTSLNSVISQMIAFQYRQKGIENVQSEGKGSLSQSFITEYPPNIMNRLNRHAKVKFL
ncbi:phage head-tail connector protein [Neobacillus drentensis]|uniref:phage head-tail connector protein n=1 Tax=Neobacillus drentensis TaxID=220684 RepID=UPI002FFE5271